MENDGTFDEGSVRGGEVVQNLVMYPVTDCDEIGTCYKIRSDDDVYSLRLKVHGQDPEYVFTSLATDRIERVPAARIQAAADAGRLRRVVVKTVKYEEERNWLLSVLDWFVVESETIATRCMVHDDGTHGRNFRNSERRHLHMMQIIAMLARKLTGKDCLSQLRELVDDSMDHAFQFVESSKDVDWLSEVAVARFERGKELIADRTFRTPEPGKVFFANEQTGEDDSGLLGIDRSEVDFSDCVS